MEGRPTLPIYQFDKNGNKIKKWDNVRQAGEAYLKATQGEEKSIKKIMNSIQQAKYDRRIFWNSFWSGKETFSKRVNVF